jgi:K(+)-stimulated pyrophosphate-energized sodium pump
MDLFILIPICALLGLLFAAYSYKDMKRKNEGNDLMKKIVSAIRLGARVYLRRQ